MYIRDSLTDVTFDVFAAEDIKAADGVSEDYFNADEKVGTITTDSNGIEQMGDLPVGKYYVKEVKTAHGYVLDLSLIHILGINASRLVSVLYNQNLKVGRVQTPTLALSLIHI